MKIFVFDKELDTAISQIMQLINLRKNGEAAELMSQPGNFYKMNYGVSLSHLKAIAQKYNQNNKLAEILWFREVRETMIIATIISDPDSMNTDQIIEWSSLVKSSELAEQFSMNLASKAKEGPLLVNSLFDLNHQESKAIALMSLGWMLRTKKMDAGNFTAEIINKTKHLTTQQTSSYYRGLSFFIRQLVRNSEAGVKQAQEWLSANDNSDNYSLKLAVEEVRTELAWHLNQ